MSIKDPQKTLKSYVSDIDQKLESFDRSHPLSASQQAEIKKYAEIYERRDKPTKENKKRSVWDSNSVEG